MTFPHRHLGRSGAGTQKTPSFVLTAKPAGDTLHCHLRGAIDESIQTVLEGHLTPAVKRCVFDMRDVNGINSWGSAKLLAVLRARPEITFSITACPWAFIDQLNMIEMMRDAFQVESVLYPLHCPSCSHWGAALLERARFADAAVALASQRCDKCGTVCELAEDPSAFLAFHLERTGN